MGNTYIRRQGEPSNDVRELTVSGSVPRTGKTLLLLNHASTIIAATLSAAQPGDELTIIDSSASGTAAHTVTCPSGATFDASGNNTATLNAPGEALDLVAISTTRWFIKANIGSVALSTV